MTLSSPLPTDNRLPLFPDLPPYPLFTRTDKVDFTDPFLLELIASRPFQRLKKVGFLGAIDYVVSSPNGRQAHRRRHNRYEHSLGVASLSYLYCRKKKLDESTTRLLTSSALLHDIGHAPLSHSLEPVFKSRLGITHHSMGKEILYGEEPLGHRLPQIMKSYNIDLDEVSTMIDGEHTGEHSYLFSGPINFDTLEGINRSSAFFTPRQQLMNPRNLVKAIAMDDKLPISAMDSFWLLKDEVYKFFIHHPAKLIFDGVAQAYCDNNIRRFSKLDFLKTEDELRRDHPILFSLFDMRQVSQIESDILSYTVTMPKRSFTIDESVSITSPSDLPQRYLQHKVPNSITISELARY